MLGKKPMELAKFADTASTSLEVLLENAGFPVAGGVTITLQIEVHENADAVVVMKGNPARSFVALAESFTAIVENEDDYANLSELIGDTSDYSDRKKQIIVALADQLNAVANQIIIEGVEAPKVSH